MKKCVDCGDAPANHTLEWVSAIIEKKLLPNRIPLVNDFCQKLEPLVAGPLFNTFTPLLMKTFVFLRLARFADAQDARTSGRARVMWEEAKRRGISIREFRLFWIGREAFLVSYQGQTKTFLDLPRPGDITSPGLAWADDKEILREKLSAENIPIARGGAVTSVAGALKLFETLRPPVIAKPEIGSRSRHTTTHIETKEELVVAFKKAAVLSPWVIIEEEELGYVYRGTVVGGRLVAVLRREPPLVNGDGMHTITELITTENKNPRRDGKIFHALQVDEEAQAELRRQGFTMESVPASGLVVTLSQKASRGIGGGTTDMTDVVHPDNQAMLEGAARVVGDPLLGIDFIISDVARSWKEQPRSGIIECNALPFIDLHHFPLVGSPRNVAGALWDIVFPTSRPKT